MSEIRDAPPSTDGVEWAVDRALEAVWDDSDRIGAAIEISRSDVKERVARAEVERKFSALSEGAKDTFALLVYCRGKGANLSMDEFVSGFAATRNVPPSEVTKALDEVNEADARLVADVIEDYSGADA
jgi:hypothetical protein